MRTRAYHGRLKLRSGLCCGCTQGARCTFRDRLHQPVVRCLSYRRDDLDHGTGRGTQIDRSSLTQVVPGDHGSGDGLCGRCSRRPACPQSGFDPPVWFCSGFA